MTSTTSSASIPLSPSHPIPSRSVSPSRLVSLILHELTRVQTTMRRNRKWRTVPHEFQSDQAMRLPGYLVQQLDQLRNTIQVENVLTIDRSLLLNPFLALITSHETNGHITCLALQAVETFILNGLVDPPPTPNGSDGAFASSSSNNPYPWLQSIVHALTHCRFEPSDESRDEVVLTRLLSLTRTCMYSTIGPYLTNVNVWKIVKNCYSIQMRLVCTSSSGSEHYSDVLREDAQQTFLDVITRVTQTVKEQLRFQQSSAPPVYSPAVFYSSVGYGYHVLHKIFQLAATLCESVHTDLNIALKIDLIHGVQSGEQEHAHIEQEQLQTQQPIPSAIPEPIPAPTPAVTVETVSPVSTTTAPADESTPQTAAPASVPVSTLIPPPLPTPTPSPPQPQTTATSSSSSHSSLPPYSSFAYRTLLPLSDLHSLGFFQLPLPSTPAVTAQPTATATLQSFANTLNANLIGTRPADTPKDIFSNWTKRANLALQLLSTLLSSIDTDLSQFPELLKYVQDNFMKFLLKNSRIFSNLSTGNQAAAANNSSGVSATFNLILFTQTLSLLNSSIVAWREYLPMQVELIIKTVYLRILSLKVTPPTPSPNSTTNPSSIKPMIDPLTLTAAYDLKELILESLLDLMKTPWFLNELFINYDCNIFSGDLAESLVKTLLRKVVPSSIPIGQQQSEDGYDSDATAIDENKPISAIGQFTQNHFLALRCLIETMKWMRTRSDTAASNGGDGSSHASQSDSSPSPDPISSTASPSTSITNWMEFVESWFSQQHAVTPPLGEFSKAVTDGSWSLNKLDQLSSTSPTGSAATSASIPARLLSHLHQSRLTKHILRHCISTFNAKPKKGMEGFAEWFGVLADYESLKKSYTKLDLPESGLMKNIQEFTSLLRRMNEFDKTSIGLFISEHDHFSTHLRRSFVLDQFNFNGSTLDDSLRMFLEAFRLPLEAQQIDRCMQAFAEGFHAQNPTVLANADAVHTLAFSLIMLNTDQHNELIKNKMTLEQFISNNRGINAGGNIPPLLLTTLYYSIKYNEIKMSGSGGTGEINDALWNDSMAQCTKLWNCCPANTAVTGEENSVTSLTRKYIRLDDDINQASSIEAAVLNLVESSTIIPARLASFIPNPSLPPSTSTLQWSSLPTLISLFSDYSIFSDIAPSTLTILQQVFDYFLTDHMIIKYDQRKKREDDEAKKKERIRFIREARAMSINQSTTSPAGPNATGSDDSVPNSSDSISRQSSTDSDYCNVSGGNSTDEDRDEECGSDSSPTNRRESIHSSASFPGNLSSHQRPAPQLAALTTQRHPALVSSAPSPIHYASSSLVPLLYDCFQSLASISCHYPQRFQPLFDRTIGILTRFISPPPLARAMSQAMGLTPGSGLGDYLPHSSRSTILARKYAALLSFGGSSKSILALQWLFKYVSHNLLLFNSIRGGWNDVLRTISYLLYLDLLQGSGGLAGNLEDFENEWYEKNSTHLPDHANHRFRRDLLTYSPPAVLHKSYSSNPSNSGGLGSSFLGLFFPTAPQEAPEIPFLKSTDMEGVELYLLSMLRGCNLPYILLEQSRQLSFTSLRTLITQLMDQATVKNSTLYDWHPEPRPTEPNTKQVRPRRASSALAPPEPEAHVSSSSRIAILTLREMDVLDASLYVDLGEDAHINAQLIANPSMTLASISPAHELNMHLIPASASCTCCFPLDYLSIPFELRRCIFFMDLLTKMVKENGWRVERLWAPIRNWMMNIITGNGLQQQTTAGSESTQPILPPLLVSSAVVSLLSILTHLYHKENMREDLMQTLKSIISLGSTAPKSSTAGSTATSKSSSFLSHTDIAVQLVCGVHLFVQTHMDHIQSPHDWETILTFIQQTSEYSHTYYHGFALLWMLIMSPATIASQSCVSLTTFQLCIDTILVMTRSRFAAPIFALKVVDLLEMMFNHLRRLLHEAGEQSGTTADNKSFTHPFFQQMRPDTTHTTPSTTHYGQAAPLTTPLTAATNASSPRLLMFYLWQTYCKPLLLALRSVSSCSTDRIRVLYNTYHFLHRQQQQQEKTSQQQTGAFGLRRPPPTAATPTSTGIPLADYVTYMQEFSHVRQQCLLLLKQVLVSDIFAQSVSECVTRFAQVAASASSPSLASTPTAVATSDQPPSVTTFTTSWCSSCFWQLCMDEILFPLLRDLSHSPSQPLFLESSTAFTLARTLCINLLSKVFLRHLPQLLQFNPRGSAGFTMTWLNVLKTMDRYMNLGVHLQRQQATHTNTGGSAVVAPPPGLLPIDGIEWSHESGVLLTESVAESLKNLVLVMKSQGIFNLTNSNVQANSNEAPSSELWSLTTAIVTPWLPFIPALQSEINPQPQPQQQPTTNPTPNDSANVTSEIAPTPTPADSHQLQQNHEQRPPTII